MNEEAKGNQTMNGGKNDKSIVFLSFRFTKAHSLECYHLPKGQDYRGTVSQTAAGTPCQNWGSLEPHAHTVSPDDYAHRGIGQHTYCRNPDDDNQPWCFTTDPDTRWAYCSVAEPSERKCRNQGG